MSTDVLSTDVAIIGNGPSGICLSYMLSGNTPYFTGQPHPNIYLQQKLEEHPDISILEQDLEYLSEGLEGRSTNPVALLFDALHHPNADLGHSEPSRLKWRQNEANKIPHVVLGSTLPGGAWQTMGDSKLTLSLQSWMELPGLNFVEWLQKLQKDDKCGDSIQNRASFSDVSKYYSEYVECMGIKENFLSGVWVKSVRRIRGKKINYENGECEFVSEKHGDSENVTNLFEVVYEKSDKESSMTSEFKIHAKNVVLATGASDLPNKLDIPGAELGFVKYKVQDLETAVEAGEMNAKSDPILVIGAGLSAADAILHSLKSHIPVVHIIRRRVNDPEVMLKQLPKAVYPEYHTVYQMMKGEKSSIPDAQYTCYDQHIVKEIQSNGMVTIYGPDGATKDIKVSLVMALIGAKANLKFLCCSGQRYCVNPKKQISSRNPINIDPYTYESIASQGIYALGPLTGNNFVRFLKGGALAICSHLIMNKHYGPRSKEL
ncbi:oxidative stress-induced growth inhibitor 1-like [Saccoglossus kowalevskii]|uniref:Oxidative stress-induced growth inhibitor 2-like n=1 Tax=Saccoglossus kowalevskii TaxID=10224 RepID=A0ABM0MPD7_SACKO|nr:PREDICTED: oxidative stress-induced growth inhibitor 2-like [Saccoglossus kowalevskii]